MTHVESRQSRPGKETIHSGHFMVSHFEAEAQDDFDDLAVPVPDEEQNPQKVTKVSLYTTSGAVVPYTQYGQLDIQQHQQLSIETSLTKLFKCMTLAYRQKLTSPKWNRFKGIKLRWKDKIRLNNVIWRCWHMQFIKKQNTLVCQFASPLDVDTHVKPEATILEGKYWKRRAEAVIAEYKKWRMFHIMRLLGKGDTAAQDTVSDMDAVESISACSDLAGNMLTDEDYLSFMSDTLFSTISSHQPFAFPDPREIARGASLADFIQPSLGPLQPNLDDFMDTLEPLHDMLTSSRLPPVPEELPDDYRALPDYAAPHHYHAHAHAHMTMHSTSATAMLPQMSEQTVKSELQLLDPRLYAAPAPQGAPAAAPAPAAPAPARDYTFDAHAHVYKPHKAVAPENCYKYNSAAIPPSATAPETVSLLQQPVQNPKYGAGAAVQPRAAYRDKPRARVHHYPAGTPYGYQAPGYQGPQGSAGPGQGYLPPAHDAYKGKQPTVLSNRAFKMPSPPLAPAPPPQFDPQMSGARGPAMGGAGVGVAQHKENFRSSSLPLGAQLNADWTITHDRQAHRSREAASVAPRLRSRSTSSGALGETPAGAGVPGGAGGAGVRRPPPLCSVASEPALPHPTVVMAQLRAQQHSQSMYKLSTSCEDVATGAGMGAGAGVGAAGAGADSPRSPARRLQASPLSSDIISSHFQCGSAPPSPPASPGSPPRRAHMHAEQKRRYNIKNGFDTLQALIPHLNSNPAAKVSKAAMLQKGAEYIRQLKAERNQVKEEMEGLRHQIDCLNKSISNCHSLLPATGAPVSRGRDGRLRELFAEHVHARSRHNWKYWLFSVVVAALVESFSACVSAGSGADLVRTTLLWAEQHCSLVEMRPAVLNSLRVLCNSTDILTHPERLPEEARAALAAAAPPGDVKPEPS